MRLKRITGLTKLWAIMNVFSALDGWAYRRKQILIGVWICWEWISLSTDAWVFCCSSTLNLPFKLLQNLTEEAALFGGTLIRNYYFTVFSKVLFSSLVSSFIVPLFFYCIFCFLISPFC